jgi:uncharacterized protein
MPEMLKHVLFVHGAGQGAYEADNKLVASLSSELGSDFHVHYPRMPNEASPRYEDWKQRLVEEVTALGDGAILVGHSFGASMVLKVLASETKPTCRRAFLIAAPFWGSTGWDWKDLELPKDASTRLSHGTSLVFYHGGNDEVVPHHHVDLYRAALPGAMVRHLQGRNHQLNDDLSEVAADIREPD